MAFEKLLDILKRQPKLNQRLEEAEALGRWAVAVGPIIAKNTRAFKVEDQVLWVEVDHPIWRSELHHRKRQILEILNGTGAEKSPRAAALPPPKQVLVDIFFVEPRKTSGNPQG